MSEFSEPIDHEMLAVETEVQAIEQACQTERRVAIAALQADPTFEQEETRAVVGAAQDAFRKQIDKRMSQNRSPLVCWLDARLYQAAGDRARAHQAAEDGAKAAYYENVSVWEARFQAFIASLS